MRWFLPDTKFSGSRQAGAECERRPEPAGHRRASLIRAQGSRSHDVWDPELDNLLRELPASAGLAGNRPTRPLQVSPWAPRRNMDTTVCRFPKPPTGHMATRRCAHSVGRVWLDRCEGKPHIEIVEDWRPHRESTIFPEKLWGQSRRNMTIKHAPKAYQVRWNLASHFVIMFDELLLFHIEVKNNDNNLRKY